MTTGNISACSWAKTVENATQDHFIGKKQNLSTTAGWALRQRGTDLVEFITADGTDRCFPASTSDKDGSWGWFCGTYNGSTQNGLLYVDGIQEATDTNIAVDSITNAVNLKTGEDADNSADMEGQLAYVSAWSGTILTAVEINEYMWKPDLMERASGYWPIWGDSSEIDLSASANTGTVTGTTTSSDGPPVMFGGGMPL